MANKYKIKASGGQHTVQTVDATNTNTVLGVRAFPTQELFARVVGGAIDIETQSKEIKVFIGFKFQIKLSILNIFKVIFPIVRNIITLK